MAKRKKASPKHRSSSAAKKKTSATAKKKSSGTKAAIKKATKKATGKKKSPAKRKRKQPRPEFETIPSTSDLVRIQFMPISPDVAYQRARIALAQEQARFSKAPKFQFLDVGYKFSGGKRTNDFSVRLHVQEKIRGPHCIGPTCGDDHLVPTDVIASNFENAASTTDAGDDIKSEGSPPKHGTLGMGLNPSGGGFTYFITCAHVVVPHGETPGDDFLVRDSDNNIVAQARTGSGLFFKYNDSFDVSLMFPIAGLPNSEKGKFVDNIADNMPPDRIADPTLDDINNPTLVYKLGGRTGFSQGFVDSIEPGDIPIDGTNLKAKGDNHFLVRSKTNGGRFARPGDSGAMVVASDGRLLGMIRAVDFEKPGVTGSIKLTVVTRMTGIAGHFPISQTLPIQP